jgi:hypothetical protein
MRTAMNLTKNMSKLSQLTRFIMFLALPQNSKAYIKHQTLYSRQFLAFRNEITGKYRSYGFVFIVTHELSTH